MRKLALALLFALVVLFAPALPGQHLEFAATFGGSDQGRGCALGYGCGLSTVTNVAVDATGNLYLAGISVGQFPLVNPIEQFPPLGCDVDCQFEVPFVTKTDPTGRNVIYSTFIPPLDGYSHVALAIDSSGNAYVSSDSPNYSIVKLDPKGNLLSKIAFLGIPTDIAVDPSGAIYVTGTTQVSNFPVTPGAYRSTLSSPQDLVLTKFDTTGKILYSTYLGPGDNPRLALGPRGEVFVAASTTSADWATTPGAVQPHCAGSTCANIIVLGLNLTYNVTQQVFATYLGGSQTDTLSGIATDAAGSLYLTGTTSSPDFPVTPGALMSKWPCDGTGACRTKAFVAHLNQTGTALAYSTFLGGSSADEGHRITVDSAGNAYVTGLTTSTDFPVLRPFQTTIIPTWCVVSVYYTGPFDRKYLRSDKAGFVSELSTQGRELAWSTFLGENSGVCDSNGNGPFNGPVGITLDSSQNIYVSGNGLAPLPGTRGSNYEFTATVVKIAQQGRPLYLAANSVTNAASFAPGLPYSGGLASLFVSGLTGVNGTVTAPGYPLPSELAGVTVKLNGKRAPILAVASLADGQEQINFQVPFSETPPGPGPVSTVVEIDYNGVATFTGALPVAPGIFTLLDGSAAVQHAKDFTLVTPAHPVEPGETLVIYGTGFGYYPAQDGVPAAAPAEPTWAQLFPPVVSIGDTACNVLYTGPTPGYVGLYQVNCQTSTLLLAGSQKLQIVVPMGTFSGFFPNPIPESQTHSNVVTVPVL